MDRKESGDCQNASQRFCTDNYEWLVTTCERALSKRGFSGYGHDVAHDVRNRCEGIDDEYWETITRKEGYLYRAIVNQANDFSKKHSHLVAEIPDSVRGSSPVKAMNDAIFLREVLQWLSYDEQQLLELMFQEYSEAEMADRMGISYVALRKRIERLKKKLCLISDGIQPKHKPQSTIGKRQHRTL
jgi:RNA polymerase sigma factor (sigma-70 family)